jgi:hypothetical protein
VVVCRGGLVGWSFDFWAETAVVQREVGDLGREQRDGGIPSSGGSRCLGRVGVCLWAEVGLTVWHCEGQGYKGSPEIVAPGKSGHQ